MRVIGTVGMPGSGKSEAAEVAEEMGIPVVTMGDVIRREAEKRDADETDESLGQVATSLREEEGEDAVAERCVDLIESELEDGDIQVVLVDGLRGWAEAERFRDEFGDDFVLVAIEAPFETRLGRIRERGRSDDVTEADDLRQRDEREIGYGMDEAIENAEVTVENTSSLEEFRDEIRSVIDEVRRRE